MVSEMGEGTSIKGYNPSAVEANAASRYIMSKLD